MSAQRLVRGPEMMMFTNSGSYSELVEIVGDPDSVEYGRLTGIEVARRMKSHSPNVSIIALTVVSDPGYQRQMRNAGIDQIINKPAELDEIARTILESSKKNIS
jgi:DNA-binding NarL/FixJ family response regulator